MQKFTTKEDSNEMEILLQLPLPDSIKRITEKVIIIGSDHQQHFTLFGVLVIEFITINLPLSEY